MCYNAGHRCYGRVHMTPVDKQKKETETIPPNHFLDSRRDSAHDIPPMPPLIQAKVEIWFPKRWRISVYDSMYSYNFCNKAKDMGGEKKKCENNNMLS